MDMTKGNYNLASTELAMLLRKPSSPGSREDMEVMRLARFVEDYEASRTHHLFEPSITMPEGVKYI